MRRRGIPYAAAAHTHIPLSLYVSLPLALTTLVLNQFVWQLAVYAHFRCASVCVCVYLIVNIRVNIVVYPVQSYSLQRFIDGCDSFSS